jgi:hypothetical protein
MAREAGYQEDMFGFGIWDSQEFNDFADLVAAAERNNVHTCHNDCQRPACVAVRKAVKAEREACAKVCDDELERLGWDANVADVVREIRARGDK